MKRICFPTICFNRRKFPSSIKKGERTEFGRVTVFLVLFILFFQSYMFIGNVVVSYAVAFITSLAFEAPMMGLEKVVLGRGKNS